MEIKLDIHSVPAGVPNPPPWQVFYHNDSEKRNETLPEAHTEGLIKLGVPELLIRLAPPGIAAAVLDRVGIHLIFEKGSFCIGTEIIIDNITYTIVPTVKDGKPMYRLTWYRDPGPFQEGLLKALDDFNVAMSLFKLKGA